jgi:hypothetical protein
MYTYPINSRESRLSAKPRTSSMAIPVGTLCVKGVRPPAAPRATLEAMMITDMIVNAFNDNASQLYRGI